MLRPSRTIPITPWRADSTWSLGTGKHHIQRLAILLFGLTIFGIGEAFLDGIPMLVISGGTRLDTGRQYQLHQLNQGNLVKEITKAYFKITSHEETISTIYKAFDLATSGEPGPVFIEIPTEIQMFKGEVKSLLPYKKSIDNPEFDHSALIAAAELLARSKNPGIYVGWGAAGATRELIEIAEVIGAPVSTTLRGKASFPASHPLHTGFGFGPNSVPACQKAFKNCDAMLEARKKANAIDNVRSRAIAYCDKVKLHFDEIRYHVDKLELIVDDECWPLPKYREMVTIR